MPRHRRPFVGHPVSLAIAAMITASLLSSGVLVAADDVVRDDPPTPPRRAPGRVRPQMGQLPERPADDPGRVPTRRAAYLGVATRPLPPELRAHLGLPVGVGLLVDTVAPGSPAARTGVQQFDVVHRFDDQLVCATEQLAALLEVAGKGKDVALTLVRGGREQVVTVKLEEREVPLAGPNQPAVMPFGGPPFGAPPFGGIVGGPMPFPMPGPIAPDNAELLRQMQQQVQEALGQAQAHARAGGPGGGVGGNAQAHAQQIGPGGHSQRMSVVSDDDGSIELRETDGVRSVRVKDRAGREVYAGPLGEEADWGRIPEDYREKVRAAVERMEQQAPPPHRRPAPPQADDDTI